MPTHNLLPGLSHNSDNVNVQVFGAPSGPVQTSGFAFTDWQRWCSLGNPNDQGFNIQVETEDVTSGAPNVTVDVLLMSMNGNMTFLGQDMNPVGVSKALNTDVSNAIETTYNTSWQTGVGSTVQASSTARLIKVATGHGTGLVAGDVLEIAMAAGANAYKQYGIVDYVLTDDVYLRFELEAIPPTSATVKKVDSIIVHQGGGAMVDVGLQMQLDFPKAGQHALLAYKAQSVGGYTMQLGGAVKTPFDYRMLAVKKTINSKPKVVLASTKITAPNALT